MLFLSVIENPVIRNRLESIYLRYVRELVFISYGILQDYHEAEDIVQTAMIKVVDYIDETTEVESNKIRGLLVIIVRRLSYTVYNQRKRRKERNIDDYKEQLSDLTTVTPELNIMKLEDRRRIAEIMDEIPEGYMDILTLRYFYEYSDSEITKLLDITEGNVRTKLSRARKAFQKVIGGDGFEE